MNYLHQNLNREKWFLKSLPEQMANVGAEIGRAINSKKEVEKSRSAFERGVELLDLTIEDSKNHGSALKELCRLKSVLVDYFVGENIYKSNDQLWNSYFYFFNASVSAKYF